MAKTLPFDQPRGQAAPSTREVDAAAADAITALEAVAAPLSAAAAQALTPQLVPSCLVTRDDHVGTFLAPDTPRVRWLEAIDAGTCRDLAAARDGLEAAVLSRAGPAAHAVWGVLAAPGADTCGLARAVARPLTSSAATAGHETNLGLGPALRAQAGGFPPSPGGAIHRTRSRYFRRASVFTYRLTLR